MIHHSRLSSSARSSGNTFQTQRLECDGREERRTERMMKEEDWVNDPGRGRGDGGVDIDCAGTQEMNEDNWE